MLQNFPYDANKPATILFAVLFGLTLGCHVVQGFRARALFMLVLIIATAMQVLGYATRYIAIIDDPMLWPLIVSQVSIVTAPAFLAAQDYMIVGRMVSFVGPGASIIPHRVITKLFVFIDVVCVLTQASGVSLLSNSDTTPDISQVRLGRWILIAGLATQVVSFVLFVGVTVAFDFKARRLVGSRLDQLRPLFTAFYVSAGLIIGRSIYRTIEFGTIDFSSTTQGYLYNNEWPFYVLDAVPIFMATVLFNVVNPARYLPRKKGMRMDGTVETPPRHWWSRTPKHSEALVSGDATPEYLMSGRV